MKIKPVACRLAKEELRWRPQRYGFVIGINGPFLRVLWNGLVTPVTYHRDKIEPVTEDYRR